MSIRLTYLLYLPLAVNFFLCQQIIIQDEFGNPIEDAYVLFNESKLWSKTNIYGITDISSIKAYDKKIIIKRYGFEDFHLDKSNEETIVDGHVDFWNDIKSSQNRVLAFSPHHELTYSVALNIFRDNIFYDVIVRGSLGCKFISTSQSEKEEIQSNFSKHGQFNAKPY